MLTTLDVVGSKEPEPSAGELAALELVRLAKEQGLSLTGPDGLLKQFTKSVLETALNEEMTGHLGHEKNRAPGTVTRPTSATAPGSRRCSLRPPDTSRSTSPRYREGPDLRSADREEATAPVERGR